MHGRSIDATHVASKRRRPSGRRPQARAGGGARTDRQAAGRFGFGSVELGSVSSGPGTSAPGCVVAAELFSEGWRAEALQPTRVLDARPAVDVFCAAAGGTARWASSDAGRAWITAGRLTAWCYVLLPALAGWIVLGDEQEQRACLLPLEDIRLSLQRHPSEGVAASALYGDFLATVIDFAFHVALLVAAERAAAEPPDQDVRDSVRRFRLTPARAAGPVAPLVAAYLDPLVAHILLALPTLRRSSVSLCRAPPRVGAATPAQGAHRTPSTVERATSFRPTLAEPITENHDSLTTSLPTLLSPQTESY